jgi:integration host factor subunit alpha
MSASLSPGGPPVKRSELVDLVLEEIAETLASDEPVKLRGFGAINARCKRSRIGRNPTTKTLAPIIARRVLTFKAAPGLIERLNQQLAEFLEW